MASKIDSSGAAGDWLTSLKSELAFEFLVGNRDGFERPAAVPQGGELTEHGPEPEPAPTQDSSLVSGSEPPQPPTSPPTINPLTHDHAADLGF